MIAHEGTFHLTSLIGILVLHIRRIKSHDGGEALMT